MATTTRRAREGESSPLAGKKLAERIFALEEEVYSKRADSAYFDFWNEATWIIVGALVAMAVALLLVVWIK